MTSHDATPDDARPGDGRAPSAPVARFVARVGAALEGPGVAERLAQADVRVRIDVADDPGATITLLLDRDPPRIGPGVLTDDPTVRLTLPTTDLDAMLDDSTHLPLAILGGDVAFEGAVRKLLRVMPILRGAVEAVEAADDGPARA
ncbi:MAG: SCP2 sterol-binding domain-containing protein [Solirubrobacteraceae bacterium]|nr:SCP2 sterol-binding domain-containing protein [Solirubrobacteraceae bacterium]